VATEPLTVQRYKDNATSPEGLRDPGPS